MAWIIPYGLDYVFFHVCPTLHFQRFFNFFFFPMRAGTLSSPLSMIDLISFGPLIEFDWFRCFYSEAYPYWEV
jgi:hypothetical protein